MDQIIELLMTDPKQFTLLSIVRIFRHERHRRQLHIIIKDTHREKRAVKESNSLLMSEKARSDRVVLGDLIVGSSMLFEGIGKKVRFAFATNIHLSV